MDPDIFLSHSGAQKGFANDLYHKLSSMDYLVFFDQDLHDSLPLGKPFPPLIFSAAATCKLAIVLLSHDFLTSKWPMLELCAFADRLSSASPPIILPLFYELSPADIKEKRRVEEWRKGAWERFEDEDKHGCITANKCEDIVTKLLPSLSGIPRHSKREQGDVSYIEQVANHIYSILYPRSLYGRFGCSANPKKHYAGKRRFCQIILDKFRELEEDPHISLPSNSVGNSVDVCRLGMYGVPGSGKSTLCRFLCDRESMFVEFRGNIIYLCLELDTRPDSPFVKQQFLKFLSKLRFSPHAHRDIASMDLSELNNLLLGARSSHKMFLVLDNICSSNYQGFKAMILTILSSSILSSGSKVMLVARSSTILENLIGEVKRSTDRYRYTITEMPCLTEAEALEVIRDQFPSVKKEILNHLLRKSSFQSSSFVYVPFVLEQIGVLLRERRCCEVEDLKLLLEMVGEAKKDALQKKLAEMNFNQLPVNLQDLFLDIAFFIIPAGYKRLYDAIPILSKMHNITQTFILHWKIRELKNHCFLSDVREKPHEEELHVHDIFIEYAQSIPGISERYVNEPSMAMTSKWRLPQCLDARTINIDACMELPSNYKDAECQVMCLQVEVGANVKALLVKNHHPHYYKCNLCLSGKLSSLVCLETKNVQSVVIEASPFRSDANFCNLIRLELKNENTKNITVKTCKGLMHKRIRRLLGLVSHQTPDSRHMRSILDSIHNGMLSIRWFLNPFSLWKECLANYSRGIRTLAMMKKLQILRLTDSGIPSLEDICRHCPQIEILEAFDESHKPRFVTIGNAPNLKRLAMGFRHRGFRPAISVLSTDSYHCCSMFKPRKSSKLKVQLGEFPQLQKLWLDAALFEQVEIVGSLPSELRNLAMANLRSTDHDSIPWKLISSGGSRLSALESLKLTCRKVERLNFTEHCCLPAMKVMMLEDCPSLTHISIGSDGLPELADLKVDYCHKLQAIEGLESLLMKQLQYLALWWLPRLQCHLKLGRHNSCGLILQVERIIVHQCRGVTFDYDILEALKKLKYITLRASYAASSVQKQSNVLNAIMFMGSNLEYIQDISLQYLDEISITSEQNIVSTSADGWTNTSLQEDGACTFVCSAGQHAQKTSNVHESNIRSPFVTSSVHLPIPAAQEQLTFFEGQFTFLSDLALSGVEHLRDIEGIEHLHKLEHLFLRKLPNLTRVSGIWPTGIKYIAVIDCPMLQELPRFEDLQKLQELECVRCMRLKSVEGSFRQWNRLRWVNIRECEGMEVFRSHGDC